MTNLIFLVTDLNLNQKIQKLRRVCKSVWCARAVEENRKQREEAKEKKLIAAEEARLEKLNAREESR